MKRKKTTPKKQQYEPRADVEHVIEFKVLFTTTAHREQIDRIVERFTNELHLQFNSAVEVEVVNIHP